MIPRRLRALALLALAGLLAASSPRVDPRTCTFKGRKLHGRIQFVTSFPDLKVQVVTSFPDLRVQRVRSFPDACGKWQIVDSFPDLKVQVVDSFPDLKVQWVESFPGPR